ncbi:glycosyltransferase family 2 protein [Adhaeribacter rhizoryzae]|uniref:Glycosyltransferase family 2 protein n=1 Tax=Adhaeribacter rhizoryzae TaxID=2607907 RepID=A0A5M6DHL1_9BACT|nr:glycosyltransferase family 2 protein [Adhaeribacter rhizoryzae]KAA5544755.1 glycosyltransferase family 2 protein [Adhaeribacter rhizoryzae]
MEFSKPLITIITPTYNRAHIIERAIDSVLKQTFEDYEYLIIDDGSKDNTLELVRNYTDRDPRIKFHSHEYNQGQNAALNTGLFKAKGKYIAFLDSDDEWLPNYLEKQLNEFLLDPEVGCSYCWAGYLDNGVLKTSRKYSIKGYLYKEALEQGYICNPTSLMVRKESLDVLGGFNLEFITCQDDDVCLRLAKINKFALIKEALVIIHNDAGNQTITNRHVYANDWLKLFNKYEKEILEYCGPKTLSKHYTKASLLFLKIYNKETSREIINKALRYQKNPKALSVWASTFLPTPILKTVLNLKKIVQ